jgi:hypothetical protein
MDGVGRVIRQGSLAALVCAASAICAFPASAAAQDELLPDLAALPLAGDETIGVFHDPTGAVFLDVGFKNANFGAGPLELGQKPEPADNSDPGNPADCDGDGDPENDRAEVQNIYLDTYPAGVPSPGDGVYQREHEATTVSAPAGCSIFHPTHDHWHGAVMTTDLLSHDNDAVGQLPKLTFCLADYTSFEGAEGLPGFVSWPKGYEVIYCTDSSVQGISIGWFDRYKVGTPGQLIDISGVPAGFYCVRQTVDSVNSVKESNESNNVSENPVYLNPAAAEVQLLQGSCAGVGPPVTDSTAPDTLFLDIPRPQLRSRGPSAPVKFRFTSTEPGAQMRCAIDGRRYAACASPVKLGLRARRGSWTPHMFSVRARDAAGNSDTSPAVWTGSAKRRARHG